MKKFTCIVCLILLTGSFTARAKRRCISRLQIAEQINSANTDTMLNGQAMRVITIVINASASFNIDAVANLYTPNAVISDDEPPFSWSGPTAGVQWVNAIEDACKGLKITKLKAIIRPVRVFQQTDEVVYIIVPVEYRGVLPDDRAFEEIGAFTFVVRMVGDKWLIKSQAWMPKKGM